MIYKMELSDSVDDMIFELLEVPIEDKDVTGIADNTTIDGNVYRDYLWLKKQWTQKWSIMCQAEYDRLRGFWLRQFGNAETPFYRLFYGDNVYEDKTGYTVNGFVQINNDAVLYSPLSLTQLTGNASQKTIDGKNLFNIGDIVDSSNTTYTQDGWATATYDNTSGASSAFCNFMTDKIPESMIPVDTPCTVVAEIKSVTGTGTLYVTSSNSATQFTPQKSYSFDLLHNGMIIVDDITSKSDYTGVNRSTRSYVRYQAGESGSITYRISVVKGTGQITPQNFVYTPFVGGTDSPNPSYPQTVNVVSGGQTVVICGKNTLSAPSDYTEDRAGLIFTCTDGVYNISGQASSGTQTSDHILTQPYTIREGDYLHLCNDFTSTVIQIAIVFSDGTFFNRSPGNSLNRIESMSSVVGKTAVKVRFYYNPNYTIEGNIKPMILNSVSTTTAYEPYQGQSYTIDLGSLELCKIGTYQDYIWNDNGTWKIHKEIGKAQRKIFPNAIAQDGSSGYNATSYYGVFFIQKTDWNAQGGDYDNDIALARMSENIGQYVEQNVPANVQANSMQDGTFCQRTGTNDRIYFRCSSLAGKTGADLKAILDAQGGAQFYYLLATPTDTAITDSDLIEQLNFVASLYEGVNNIMLIPSAGEQGEINFKYRLNYEEEQDIVPKTPVVLTLTDGGVINPCGCRENIQLVMRETEGGSES